MRITVLGLGIIGSIWARHLAADGHQVRTWNRTPKPDALGFTADLRAAVAEAELVAIVVADPAAVASVLTGCGAALRPGVVVAQHSTIGPADTEEAARRVRALEGRFLDMPFTGSKPAAEGRQSVFYVGDDDGTLELVRPVYERLSRAILPLGGVGQASAVKVAMNTLIANLNQAMIESLELTRQAGVAPERWAAALELNPARSGMFDLKRDKYLKREYSPQFSVKHMRKDLRLALGLAHQVGVLLPLTATTERAYAEAEEMGLSELDLASLLEVVRRQLPE